MHPDQDKHFDTNIVYVVQTLTEWENNNNNKKIW